MDPTAPSRPRATSPARGMARMESKQDVLLTKLRRFFSDPGHLATLTELLNSKKPRISLRVLDWLITNYSKKNPVSYALPSGKRVNVHVMYKAQLDGYSKRYFDPFRRRDKVRFVASGGQEFDTTVGQLNFFHWAISNGVLDYGLRHAAAIEKDMLEAIRRRDPPPQSQKVATTARTKAIARALSHKAQPAVAASASDSQSVLAAA